MPKVPALFTAALALLIAGCGASLRQSYYISAVNPADGTTNYFRITLDGNVTAAEAKYSVGFYDKDAVERLFGEAAFERLLVGHRLELFNLTTKEKLAELAGALDKARAIQLIDRREQLEIGLGHALGVIKRYEVELTANPEMASRFAASIADAKSLAASARKILEAQTPTADALAKATGELTQMQAIVEGIRIAVDGDVLVRFFDGAGNELDVANKTLVIFVASDASRFAEALRQLAESKEVSQNLLYTVLGDRIQEADFLARRVALSDTKRKLQGERLMAVAAPAATVPENRDGKSASEIAALDKKENAALGKAILDSAQAIADQPLLFQKAEDIENFAKALAGVKP